MIWYLRTWAWCIETGDWNWGIINAQFVEFQAWQSMPESLINNTLKGCKLKYDTALLPSQYRRKTSTLSLSVSQKMVWSVREEIRVWSGRIWFLSLSPPPPVLQICNLGEPMKVNEPPPNTTSRCPSPKSRWVSLLPCLESPLLKTQSHSFLTCHDLNSRWPKIWPMTLGQRFDLKGSPYSTLVVNQNTVKFFFLHIHLTRVLTN